MKVLIILLVSLSLACCNYPPTHLRVTSIHGIESCASAAFDIDLDKVVAHLPTRFNSTIHVNTITHPSSGTISIPTDLAISGELTTTTLTVAGNYDVSGTTAANTFGTTSGNTVSVTGDLAIVGALTANSLTASGDVTLAAGGLNLVDGDTPFKYYVSKIITITATGATSTTFPVNATRLDDMVILSFPETSVTAATGGGTADIIFGAIETQFRPAQTYRFMSHCSQAGTGIACYYQFTTLGTTQLLKAVSGTGWNKDGSTITLGATTWFYRGASV